jgi:hypothetical protein
MPTAVFFTEFTAIVNHVKVERYNCKADEGIQAM